MAEQQQAWWRGLEAEARDRQRELAEAELLAWWRQRHVRTMTVQELEQSLREAIVCDVPAPPDTLGEVLRIQKERGLR